MRKTLLPIGVLAVALAVCLGAGGITTATAGNPLELYKQIEDLQQRLFWRTAIAPPNGSDMVFYWEGKVYFDIPGDSYAPPWPNAPGNYYAHGGGNGGTPIFGFVGYNIRRVIPHSDPARVGDFIQGSRELVFYTWLADGTDPATSDPVLAGDIVTSWKNPLTGKVVPVYPITNEYLWEHYRVGTYPITGNGTFDYNEYVDDGVLRSVITISYGSDCPSFEYDSPVSAPEEWATDYNWSFEVFPRYKLNDCGRWDIDDPMNLKNGKYTSMEAFSFWVPKITDLRLHWEMQSNRVRRWLPKVNLNWVRIGSFPPWMGMYEGEATAASAAAAASEIGEENDIPGFDGRIIYSVRSELLRSYNAMPDDFKANMSKYFGEMNAQDLETIGLMDGDGDGWEVAPAVHDPTIKRDTSYSVFYFKNMGGEAGQSWVEWVNTNIPGD